MKRMNIKKYMGYALVPVAFVSTNAFAIDPVATLDFTTLLASISAEVGATTTALMAAMASVLVVTLVVFGFRKLKSLFA